MNPGLWRANCSDQRLDLPRRAAAGACGTRRGSGSMREQVREPLVGDRQEPRIGRDPHDRLRDAQA